MPARIIFKLLRHVFSGALTVQMGDTLMASGRLRVVELLGKSKQETTKYVLPAIVRLQVSGGHSRACSYLRGMCFEKSGGCTPQQKKLVHTNSVFTNVLCACSSPENVSLSRCCLTSTVPGSTCLLLLRKLRTREWPPWQAKETSRASRVFSYLIKRHLMTSSQH